MRDDIVDKVHQRVLEGMGLIVMHSGHYSKIFKKLMGTGCGLKWREAAERELLWNVNPGHPITQGIGEHIDLPHVEMYGELFDIPEPDELIFISWFAGGEVFRSGCTFTRGRGRIFTTLKFSAYSPTPCNGRHPNRTARTAWAGPTSKNPWCLSLRHMRWMSRCIDRNWGQGPGKRRC